MWLGTGPLKNGIPEDAVSGKGKSDSCRIISSFCSDCFFCCFFLLDDFLEGEDFFFNNRGKNEDGNQVRDSHEGIGNIGKVPYQVQGLGGAYEDHQGEDYPVNDVVLMGAQRYSQAFSPLYSQPRMVE